MDTFGAREAVDSGQPQSFASPNQSPFNEPSSWRNIMGSSASSRFHRAPYGLGLSSKAQAHIKSLRTLTNGMGIFTCVPHNDLLSDRKPNEGYCLANPGKEYAVYFPNGGQVGLHLSHAAGKLTAKWLDIAQSRWAKDQTLRGGGKVTLTPPGKGHWAVWIAGNTDRRRAVAKEKRS